MKRTLALVLAMIMMLGMFAGCSKTETETTTTAAAEGETTTAAEGEELDAEQYYNTYIGAEPTTLDISRSSDTYGGTILTAISEPLTRLADVDGEYKVIPAAAKEWSVSDDGLVWTFKLNENKWRDGSAVTANDFVYAYRRLADPDTAAPLSYMFECIKGYKAVQSGEAEPDTIGVKAVDDLTLEITLEAPTPHFMSLTSLRFAAPLNQAAVEEHGEAYGSELDKLECNGPFYIESWTHQSEIVLKKNPNYWNADEVKLETVTYRIIGDENTAYNEFEIGGIDYVSTGKKEWVDRFDQKEGTYRVTYPLATESFIFFNQNDELFSNANIRKAFSIGLDRADINEVVFTGLRVPATGWVASAIAVGETNYREQAGDMIAELSKQGEAKELLLKGMEELGLGSDPATLDITFSLGGTDQWYRTMGEYLQQAYKESLGVNLKIQTNEWAVFSDNAEAGNYQLGFMSWGAFYNDPIDVLNVFKSTSGSVNTGWVSEEYDSLLDKASVEMDEAARTELYIQAEKILVVDDCVIAPVADSTGNYFYYDYVKGFSTLAMSNTGVMTGFTSGRE